MSGHSGNLDRNKWIRGLILPAFLTLLTLAATVASLIGTYYIDRETEPVVLTDINELNSSQLKPGLQVNGTIYTAVCCYAESYHETNNMLNKSETDYLYYLIPVYSSSESNSDRILFFITLQALPEQFDELDQIVSQSWSEAETNVTLAINSGHLAMLPSDIRGFMTNYVNSPDFNIDGSFVDICLANNLLGSQDEKVIQASFVPYMITVDEEDTGESVMTYCFLILFVMCLAVLLFSMLYKRPSRRILSGENE